MQNYTTCINPEDDIGRLKNLDSFLQCNLIHSIIDPQIRSYIIQELKIITNDLKNELSRFTMLNLTFIQNDNRNNDMI